MPKKHSELSLPPARLFPRLSALLASLFLMTAVQGKTLPPTVAGALVEAGIPERSVAVVVRSVDTGNTLVKHNVEQAMNPASVMKLLTTYAGLEILGPAYTWKTEALSTALPGDGRLDGNLYLRGSGDPRLGLEQFWLFLQRLRARGVSHIQGDLVLDRSAFALPPHDPGEFDNEPLRPYNVGPDALLVNLKSLHVTLRPDAGRRAVTVVQETPGIEPAPINHLQLSDDTCGDWREKFTVTLADATLTLRGSFPAACGDKALNLAPWPADLQVERLFRALWQELGGTLQGQVRTGVTPAHAQVLTTHESPALGEIVREINKYSNNVMARQLFLSLDKARPATPEGARRRIDEWLREKSLAMPELVLENGSGLSRRERISAENLARLLLAAWESPVMPELMASLPLAGIDGTLRRRLGTSPVNGRAHLKTGYLENARALAGYVLDNNGKRWIVVFQINDPRSRHGRPAMDALLHWVAARGDADRAPAGPRR